MLMVVAIPVMLVFVVAGRVGAVAQWNFSVGEVAQWNFSVGLIWLVHSLGSCGYFFVCSLIVVVFRRYRR